MAEKRDRPHPQPPKGFDDPGRRLTPQSARRIVSKGAAELAVDDFVDSYLKERPKTLPKMAIPPEVVAEKASMAPTVRPPAPAPRERGRLRWSRPEGQRQDPREEPRSEPPIAAENVPQVEEEMVRALADKEDRISELEVELERVKAELVSAKVRQSSEDLADAAAPSPPAAPDPYVPPPDTPPVTPPPSEVGLEIAKPAVATTGGIVDISAGATEESAPGLAMPRERIPQHTAPKAWAEAAPAPKRGRAWVWIAALASAAAIGVGAFVIARGRAGDEATSTARETPAAEPAHSTAPTPAASTKSSPASTSPPASPSSASAASASSAPAVSVAPIAADSPEDMKKLLSFQAYLTVTSPVDATVIVQGFDAGHTNERLLVRCGPRNVRLRAADGQWLSSGDPVQIKCMEHTHVQIEPRN